MEGNVINLITRFALDLSEFIDGEIPGIEIHMSDENCNKIEDEIKSYAEAHEHKYSSSNELRNGHMCDPIDIKYDNEAKIFKVYNFEEYDDKIY